MVDTPFAFWGDVEARWRTLTTAERVVADTLAQDASDMIRDRWSDVDARIAAGSLRASSLTRIVAGMVKRALNVGDAEGLESRSQAAGPFQVSDKFTNPNANLFLQAADVRVLDGKPGGRAFAVDLATPSLPDDYYWTA